MTERNQTKNQLTPGEARLILVRLSTFHGDSWNKCSMNLMRPKKIIPHSDKCS